MEGTLNVKKVLILVLILVIIAMVIVLISVRKINSKATSISPVEENQQASEVQNDKNTTNNTNNTNVAIENKDVETNDTNVATEPKKDISNQETWTNSGVKNENTKGVIYLTFDDGPSTDITPQILDILKEENVKATFFILNYGSNKEEIVKREMEEGHSVGIHGYSHDYKEIYKSEEKYMENLNKLQTKIEETTGVKTIITRFPGGSSNTISKFNKGIMTKLTKLVEENGYKYYDWNVDSDDAGSAKNKKQVYKNVTENLSKKRSNVVLMHDFADNTKTLNALEDIIKFGKENGYEFKAITANSDLVMHHRVFN